MRRRLRELRIRKRRGLLEIDELYPLIGAYVNLVYPMPSGDETKILNDKEIYLADQVKCDFNDGSKVKCSGLVAGLDFLLVSEYGINCSEPQIVIFKKR